LPDDLLATTHLFVIGRDKGDHFERMAMRLGITAQVTFFCQGRDDVPEFLFAADGLIHPAYDEAAGMVIVEAILAGVPAVVTHNCGYAKYIKQYDAGIVLPLAFSQQHLDKALVEILTSNRRAQWIANGLSARHDQSLFNLVPTVVDKLEQFVAQSRTTLVFTLFRYFPFGGLQRDFLRYQSERVADSGVVGGMSKQLDRAAVHSRAATDASDQRRLAGAIGSEQGNRFTTAQRERHAVERTQGSKRLFDVAKLQHRQVRFGCSQGIIREF